MRRPVIGTAVVLALVSAVALSGCSDSDDTGAKATTTTQQRSTTTAKPYASPVYSKAESWLCRPDVQGDACDGDLDATLVAADGTKTVEKFQADPEAPVDCFYVYPTISTDPGSNSDMVPGEAERNIAANQAARLGSVCRVFAPVYRQVPLGALFDRIESSGGITTTTAADGTPTPYEVAYSDVEDAFRQYLANDNNGRPFVLIGHSQGAGMLTQLVEKRIDGDPQLREQMLSAILAGGGVRSGEGNEAQFDNITACTSATDTGCYLSWATFAAGAPPPADSFFGRPREGGGRVACTNPASLKGGSGNMETYVTAGHVADAPAVDTPWIHYSGLESAECMQNDDFDWLQVTNTAAAGDARPADIGGRLTPQWGLHLMDVNLAMGNLVELVRTQSEQKR